MTPQTLSDPVPASAPSIGFVLAADHDRLDGLEAAAFEARGRRQFPEAARLIAEFAQGLRRHIRYEEEVLFPEFDRVSGLPTVSGPTAVMKMEHREILSILELLEAAMGDPLAPTQNLRGELRAVLLPHNHKEEAVVYPGVDARTDASEQADMVRRFHDMR